MGESTSCKAVSTKRVNLIACVISHHTLGMLRSSTPGQEIILRRALGTYNFHIQEKEADNFIPNRTGCMGAGYKYKDILRLRHFKLPAFRHHGAPDVVPHLHWKD